MASPRSSSGSIVRLLRPRERQKWLAININFSKSSGESLHIAVSTSLAVATSSGAVALGSTDGNEPGAIISSLMPRESADLDKKFLPRQKCPVWRRSAAIGVER